MGGLRLPAKCGKCWQDFDEGTAIFHIVYQDGAELERVVLCSRACFLDYIEDEVIDNRVEKAKRDELQWLHEKVCPPCKNRLMKAIAHGDVPENKDR